MEAEVAVQVGAGYAISETRLIGDGYRPRRWDTRAGSIELQIPKLRQGSTSPPCSRRRAERALLAVVQQAYVEGVSTRRVDDLVRSLGLRGTAIESPRARCHALQRARHRRHELPRAAARRRSVPLPLARRAHQRVARRAASPRSASWSPPPSTPTASRGHWASTSARARTAYSFLRSLVVRGLRRTCDLQLTGCADRGRRHLHVARTCCRRAPRGWWPVDFHTNSGGGASERFPVAARLDFRGAGGPRVHGLVGTGSRSGRTTPAPEPPDPLGSPSPTAGGSGARCSPSRTTSGRWRGQRW